MRGGQHLELSPRLEKVNNAVQRGSPTPGLGTLVDEVQDVMRSHKAWKPFKALLLGGCKPTQPDLGQMY